MNDKIRILIIEDNPADSRFVSILIKNIYNSKAHIAQADTLTGGLKIAKESQYDVIILDLSLPDSSGLETFIKLNLNLMKVPIIVLTGVEDQTIGINAVKMGAQDFLQKGEINESILKKSISYSIERQKLVLSLEEKTSALYTERQKLSEAQKLAHIGNWEWNVFTEEVTWSDEFYRIHGMRRGEDKLHSDAITSFIHPEDIQIVRNIIQNITETHKQSTFTYRIRRKDGTIRTLISTGDVILNEKNEVIKLIGTGQDITERVQEEDVKKANQVAERSLQIKEQFLANMSHEIRTPMNAIVGFTRLILKTPLSEEQQKYTDAIKTSGENLLVIINDILDFSKIQAGKVHFERTTFHIGKVLASVKELMLSKSQEKNIILLFEIDKDIPELLVGDPTRLDQILNNLIGNAIKFTEKGEIKIALNVVKKDNNSVDLKFSVSDTGIGISADKLTTIFDTFTQASEETTRKYGGTGLGLAIVKQLIEQQGGSISVQSELKKGTTFSFSLTLDIGKEENKVKKEQAILQPIVIAKRLNILLVEDNELNSLLAKKILSDWNWNVDIAGDAFIAINNIQQTDYDLVLMDIQLPEMDGYEATRKIRNDMEWDKRNIPIIAMTAHAFSSEEEKCLKAGMNGYISKPFDPKNLYVKIVEALNIGNESLTQK